MSDHPPGSSHPVNPSLWSGLRGLALGLALTLPFPGTVPAASPLAPVRPGPTDRPAPEAAAGRGAIRDCTGRTLVCEAPCWDVLVRYELLVAHVEEGAGELAQNYLRSLARARGEDGKRPDAAEIARRVVKLEGQVARTWKRLAVLTRTPPDDLVDRAGRAIAQVRAMKQAVQRARGHPMTIGEERSPRFLLRIDRPDQAAAVEKELGAYAWVRIARKTRRTGKAIDPLTHVIGRVGTADPKRASADPLAGDELRRLREGDRCGISGVERLADHVLRPARGPADRPASTDVTITIDAELQRDVYKLLKKAVGRSPYPAGGAAVVIDVPTGEIRALVSYPSYPYDRSATEPEYPTDDPLHLPLRFRAVSDVHPPGSTIKPVVLYGSLCEGAITTGTKVTCDGAFRKSISHAFRCWLFNRSGDTHGVQVAETAVQHSCNIFFFNAGDRLGPDHLVEWLARFGFGRTQGTGLIEESHGIVPTPEWLTRYRPKTTKLHSSDAWNLAVGQGDLGVTPLQLANLAATIARGRFRPVVLAKDATGRSIASARPTTSVELSEQILATIRRGMWRVVNAKGGTADRARLRTKGFALCGKTGSAQVPPRVVGRKYTFGLKDGTRFVVGSPTLKEARTKLTEKDAPLLEDKPGKTYPADTGDNLRAHAWFIGYTQSASTLRGGRPAASCYALSVLVEFGGAGGEFAAPVGREIADRLVAAGARSRKPSVPPTRRRQARQPEEDPDQ